MVPRTPLRPIDSNRPRGNELSPYLRGRIKGASVANLSIAQIGQLYGKSKSTIQYTLEQETARNEGKSRQRSCRPSILSEIDNATMTNLIQAVPFFY